MIDDFICIGQVRKTHGVKGLIRLYIDSPFEKDFVKSNFIYIDVNGDFVPFFFESKEGGDHFYLVKFDDIHTPEDAKKMAAFSIYLTKDKLDMETISKLASDDGLVDKKYSGYKISVIGREEYLTIDRIVEYPHQWMASVTIDGREALIPIVDAYIVDDNPSVKLLTLDLPDGLI